MWKAQIKFVLTASLCLANTIFAADAIIKNLTTSITYTDLQVALNATNSGETLDVSEGDCHPGVTNVNNQYATSTSTKSFSILNKDNITIKGKGLKKTVITNLNIDNCNNLLLQDVQIRGGFYLNHRTGASFPHSGLKVTGSDNFTLARSSVISGKALTITGGAGHLLARNVIGLYNSTFDINVTDIKIYHNKIYAASEYLSNSVPRPINSTGGFTIATLASNKVEIKNNIIYSGSIWADETGYGDWIESSESLRLNVNVTAGSNNIEGNIFADFNNGEPTNGVIDSWSLAEEKIANRIMAEPNNLDLQNRGVDIDGYSFDDFVPVMGTYPDIGNEEIPEKDKFVKAIGNELYVHDDKFRFKGIAFTNWYYLDDLEDIYDNTSPGHVGKFTDIKHHRLEDFFNVKSMGFNTERFALNADWFENTVTDNSTGLWTWIDNSIHMARTAGLYVVLEMHQPPGETWLDNANIEKYPANDPIWFWNDINKENKLYEIWTAIATRYKDNNIVAAYGVLNEPKSTDLTGEQWYGPNMGAGKGVAEKLIDAVRAVDEKHLILMDGYAGSIADPDDSYPKVWSEKFSDNNLIYDTHFYYHGDFTHKGAGWGGGIDNGSIYPDNYMAHATHFWNNPKSTEEWGLWNDAVRKTDYSANNGTWKKYTTSVLVATNNHAILDMSFEVKGTYGTQCEVLVDHMVLEEKDASGNWKIIRNVPATDTWLKNSNGTYSSVMTTDGYMNLVWSYPYDAAGEEHDKVNSFFIADEGAPETPETPATDHVSYGIRNVKTNAVWTQTWIKNIIPVTGNSYRLSAYVKVNGAAPSSLEFSPVITPYKDPENILTEDGKIQGFTKEYLYSNTYGIDFGKDNNVPVSYFEFGLMEACYKNQLNGESFGGNQWMEDLITKFDVENVHWAAWAYRNDHMGIYKGECSNDDGSIITDYLDINDQSQLNPGIYNGITSVALRQTEPRKIDLGNDLNINTIFTENFENGWNDWSQYNDYTYNTYYNDYAISNQAEGYVMSEGINNNAMVTYINNYGTEPWHIHAKKTSINIVNGETYTVSIKTRTEAGNSRQIGINIGGGASLGYVSYAYETITIDGTLKEYSFTFTMNNQSNSNAEISIDMGNFSDGNYPLDVIIDDIKIIK